MNLFRIVNIVLEFTALKLNETGTIFLIKTTLAQVGHVVSIYHITKNIK